MVLKRKPMRRKPMRIKRSQTILKRQKLQRGTPLLKKRLQGKIEASKRKKKTKADKYREWLIPEYIIRGGGLKSLIRYSDPLRGIYWYWLSKDVRKKEWEQWGGLCITCLKPIERWEDGQCGHVVSSAECGEFLRFDRRNLTIQHGGCNNPRFSPNAPALNAIHYDQRHGQGAWQWLYDQRKVEAKNPSQEKYRVLIRNLDSFREAQKELQDPV